MTTVEARGIEALLAGARDRLSRLSPAEAHAEQRAGALLVDIWPHAQRVAEGEVPGALVLERNVLEWRLDPTSDARIAQAEPDLRVVVLCSEGYTSSLAAAVPCSGMELTPYRNRARPGDSSSMPNQSKVSDGSTSSFGRTTHA